MSIRKKILTSYVLMILMPVVLMVLFGHLLFFLFDHRLDDIRAHFNLDRYTLEDFLHGEMMTIAELQTILRENPDQLLDDGVLEQYGHRLAGRKISIVLMQAGHVRYVSDELADRLAAQLPVDELGRGDDYKFREHTLYPDDRWVVGLQYAFRFADQSAGNLYLLLDADPVNSLVNRLVPSLAIAFLVALVVASAGLTIWMSRRILHPIRELKEAAEHIKAGQLEHAVDVRCQDELGQLGRAFEEMRQRLRDSVQDQLKMEQNRKQLIAHISHDLKTPITAIMGYVEGMLDGVADSPERMDKYARTIHMHAREMDRLIDELFLYSKLDLNRVPFRFVDIDMHDYVEGLVEEFKLRMESAGVVMAVELSDKPLRVQADPDQLKRVFANVIGNSFNHMDKDEKHISLRLAPDEAEEGYIRIEIRDNGAGIDREALPHVFDHFYRAESSRHKNNGGSGLGLAIARQIVKAHGGKIWADSELGKGTLVAFTLRETRRPD